MAVATGIPEAARGFLAGSEKRLWIGLPAGVMNVLNGIGETTGDAVVRHPGIEKIAFTGSAERRARRAGGDLRAVVVALPFRDEDELVRKANDTVYGLGAAVWSSNAKRARRVAHRIEAGTVWINHDGRIKRV